MTDGRMIDQMSDENSTDTRLMCDCWLPTRPKGRPHHCRQPVIAVMNGRRFCGEHLTQALGLFLTDGLIKIEVKGSKT